MGYLYFYDKISEVPLAISNVSMVIPPEQESEPAVAPQPVHMDKDKTNAICKGCKKPLKNIKTHLTMTKENCKKAYIPEEKDDFGKLSNNKRAASNRISRAKYRKIHAEDVSASRERYKANHPKNVTASKEKYRQNHPENIRASREKCKEKHPEKNAAYAKKFKKNHPETVTQTNKKQFEKNKVNPGKQIGRFRQESHGPIFTCICCMRDLFQRAVVELKGDIKKTILKENKMHGYLNFDKSLKVKDEIHYKVVTKNKTVIKSKETTRGLQFMQNLYGLPQKIKNASYVC